MIAEPDAAEPEEGIATPSLDSPDPDSMPGEPAPMPPEAEGQGANSQFGPVRET